MLLEIEGDIVKNRINLHFQNWANAFFQGYGKVRNTNKLTEAEKSVGMIDSMDYVKIFHSTLRSKIIPGMEQRNIVVKWNPSSDITDEPNTFI